ncbi:hypothetical protein B7494_g2617 [Chlorociboria aeruginascens]|nr:hypothetical protein B7494_g2617 [Chlorociboria aeruginascens]
MRAAIPSTAPLNPIATYRAATEEEESQSSSSNSPARADYDESDFFTGNNDSQSSIGCITFQDMAVSEQCVSPADRLPAEVLIGIFSKLTSPLDLVNCMRVSKRWARNSVDQLWHRPACTSWDNHSLICRTLSDPNPYFQYRDFIKRLNLANLHENLNDGSVLPLSVCTRIERLTLTNCDGLTDSGLVGLLTDSSHLLALDISIDVSLDSQITETSMFALADNCSRLQGLNISGCSRVSNDSLIKVAEKCRYLKRLKLNGCNQVSDDAVLAFAHNCPNILEIDLHQCRLIGNEPVTALLSFGRSLRELRLANCELITDLAFLSLAPGQTFEHLRILDLTNCMRLTDRAIEKIIDVAPRLRNLVFAKCRNLTDLAVNSISKLGKNLHYLHLGHCGQITDAAVIRLVQLCNRIRYIDLGCCTHLTDMSVTKLASLPKLRRIGLVKCSNITNESVYALAHSRRQTHREDYNSSSLERVHLSYCTNLSLSAFLRQDLEQYCREAPPEHQRNVFCVFSGIGVQGLRVHLNKIKPVESEINDEFEGPNIDPDDDQTMTGMMGAAALNGDEDDGDEDLDDGDASQHFANAGHGL